MVASLALVFHNSEFVCKRPVEDVLPYQFESGSRLGISGLKLPDSLVFERRQSAEASESNASFLYGDRKDLGVLQT